MCGIVGAVTQRNVAPILLEGLKRLEYRGYDSAGMVVLNEKQQLQRYRVLGKICNLENKLKKEPLLGKIGLAHTRWATHGKPAENNTHPHFSGNTLAVVHNGIIENYLSLRSQLIEKGYIFSSDTDTEVIGHLLQDHLNLGYDFFNGVKETAKQLKGMFSAVFLSSDQPDRLLAIQYGNPLVIGIGVGEYFIASSNLALLPVTQRFIYLEETDIADIRCDQYIIYNNAQEKVIDRPIHLSQINQDTISKGRYRHFMQKEIFEQPQAVIAALQDRLKKDKLADNLFGVDAETIFKKTQRIRIAACGSSYHAGCVARYWLETFARIPCQVEVSSEIRYRQFVMEPNTLFITLSQSGETADTLAALRHAKLNNYLASLAICNMPESSLVRESDLIMLTRAGPEIGVASTKAFTTQLTVLLLLTAILSKYHNNNDDWENCFISPLNTLSSKLEQVLKLDQQIKQFAKLFSDKQHALFIARGVYYPIALEAALKLKEISYIHAEAYPAGELKHGPLALVDNKMPVIVLMPQDELLEKLESNIQEVQARDGQLILFADQKIQTKYEANDKFTIIRVPSSHPLIAPLIYTIPLQLLAYHVAVLNGTDIDQPRNLAKSVTVE